MLKTEITKISIYNYVNLYLHYAYTTHTVSYLRRRVYNVKFFELENMDSIPRLMILYKICNISMLSYYEWNYLVDWLKL